MTFPLSKLELPQYFTGQRLTATQLNANVTNERNRRWFHNRALHGSGVSAGLIVSPAAGGKAVVVQPGHAIDPYGRDLVVAEPVTVQVPPVSGSVDDEGKPIPERFVVVVRWSDGTTAVTGSGPCEAAGIAGLPETATVEILRNAQPWAVPLALLEVHDCAILSLSLSPRTVLGERRLPRVDGGRFEPNVDDWGLASAGTPAKPYGLVVTVDTTVAGFQGVPRYQAQVSGSRRGAVSEQIAFVLWTPDTHLTAESRRSVTIEITILTVWQIEKGVTTSQDLSKFLTDNKWDVNNAQRFRQEVVQQLKWAVTWIGVEGTI